MNKHASNRELSLKEIDTFKNLAVVRKQRDLRQNPHEKFKTWVMPALGERYIKHKKNDPL